MREERCEMREMRLEMPDERRKMRVYYLWGRKRREGKKKRDKKRIKMDIPVAKFHS
jgi:hypothetical protein